MAKKHKGGRSSEKAAWSTLKEKRQAKKAAKGNERKLCNS